jgi:hypothetical protein
MRSIDNILGLRAIARHILSNCKNYHWTLQGFGMLRLHLPDNHRLHVWNHHYAVCDVSTIHDHLQWGLHSTIIGGALVNRILEIDPNGDSHMVGVIKPGIQETPGKVLWREPPKPCGLYEVSRRVYLPGEQYEQAPSVIHESLPEDGTVTLIRKTPTEDESARIFWPIQAEWVSAEPRAATRNEIESICGYALARMDADER